MSDVSKWRSAEHNPPKLNERVLVYYWCAEDYTKITVGEYLGEQVGFILDDDNMELCFVTHWQPLPKPPTESEVE